MQEIADPNDAPIETKAKIHLPPMSHTDAPVETGLYIDSRTPKRAAEPNTTSTRPSAVAGAVPFFNVGPESYKEIAQSILVLMQNARSIENGTIAYMPLAGEATQRKLKQVQTYSQEIWHIAKSIYDEIALSSFKG